MPFRPNPNDTITIAGTTYTFTEHPAAPGMAYGQRGRRGVVYRMLDEQGGAWALKVFLPAYCEPRLVGHAERIRSYAALPAMRVCEREVLTASMHRKLLREIPELNYAVIMPWIEGKLWMEVILDGEILPMEQSLAAANALASALVGLEERGLAHCDLSGPNLIQTRSGGIEFVDLEEMNAPGLMEPEQLPGGSPGYAHKTAPHDLWQPKADRFAGGVLLAEMLGWSDAGIVQLKWGEGYFDPEEMGSSCERFRVLKNSIAEHWGGRLPDLLEDTWYSETVSSCPTFSEWFAALPEEVPGPVGAGQHFSTGKVDTASAAAAEVEEVLGRVGAEEKHQRPVQDQWICPVCSRTVDAGEGMCPFCEKGVRNAEKSEAGGSPDSADEKAAINPPCRNLVQDVSMEPLEKLDQQRPILLLSVPENLPLENLQKSKIRSMRLPGRKNDVQVLKPAPRRTPVSDVLLELLYQLPVMEVSKGRSVQLRISQNNIAVHKNHEGPARDVLALLMKCVCSDCFKPLESLSLSRAYFDGVIGLQIMPHFKGETGSGGHWILRIGEDSFLFFTHRVYSEAGLNSILSIYWMYRANEWWKENQPEHAMCDLCSSTIHKDSTKYLWGSQMLCMTCGANFFTRNWPGSDRIGQDEILAALRFYDDFLTPKPGQPE